MSDEEVQSVRRELADRSGGSAWQILVHRRIPSSAVVPSGADYSVAGGDDVSSTALDWHNQVAEQVAVHRTIIIGDVSALAHDLEGSLGDYASVLGVPVFDPNVFDPDPQLRPAMGIVTFASSKSVKQMIGDVELRGAAQRLATSLVLGAAAAA